MSDQVCCMHNAQCTLCVCNELKICKLALLRRFFFLNCNKSLYNNNSNLAKLDAFFLFSSCCCVVRNRWYIFFLLIDSSKNRFFALIYVILLNKTTIALYSVYCVDFLFNERPTPRATNPYKWESSMETLFWIPFWKEWNRKRVTGK